MLISEPSRVKIIDELGCKWGLNMNDELKLIKQARTG
jgi:hypothetical protein